MSSKDFYPRVIQDGKDNYVVAGSTADIYTATNAPDLTEVENYDAFIVSTPNTQNSAHNWRRNVHAHNEEAMCVFALAGTADGGFIIGGDNPGENELDNDNFSITKFAPDCAQNEHFDLHRGNIPIFGTTTWSSYNWKIAGKVMVMPGANLTIDNCNLKFASSDHLYDYWEFKDIESYDERNQVGIVVMPGGHLIVNNSTLEGLDDCNSNKTEDRFMWDGIVVQGDPSKDKSATGQGSVEFYNSIIRDARMGTIADNMTRMFSETTADMPTSSPEYKGITSSSRYWAYGSYGGASINAKSTTWKDCRFSVNYQQYNKKHSQKDIFEDCHFLATKDGMADVCFYASPDGNRLPSSTFFGAWDVQQVYVNNSQFLCDGMYRPSQWPTAIYAGDVGFVVAKSRFSNLAIGIWATYTAGLNAKPLSISGNVFDRVGNGINVANAMNNMTVIENSFFVPGDDVTGHPGGILLQNCTGYSIRSNTFDKSAGYPDYPGSSRGIQVSFGDSWTDYNNTIHNNSFNHLRHPVIALQKNSSQDYRFGL